MSGRTYYIANGKPDSKNDWKYDKQDEARSPVALQKLIQYVNDPTNHLRKYEEEVNKTLLTLSEQLNQISKHRGELETEILGIKGQLKESESCRERYRNERNTWKQKFENAHKDGKQKQSNEQELKFIRAIEELKSSHEEKEREWEKRLRDSEESSDEIIRNQKLKLEQNEKDMKHKDLKIRNLEERLESSRFDLTDSIELKKKLEVSREQLNNTSDTLQRALTKLGKTERELEETKTRLSKAMGDKLTDNNPNIADLSDKNRPTKLAEKYAELYDNEWTDAYERIEDSYDCEEDVIKALLEILLDVMKFCKMEAMEQMETLQRTLACSGDQASVPIPDNITKQLKDLRKAMSTVAKENLYKVYMSKMRTTKNQNLKHAREIEPFVRECFEICWLMAVQDPPVDFCPISRTGEALNSDIYKPYTSSGRHIQFVVWPALLLHESGPVLAKGVAQGMNDKQRKTKQVWTGNAGMSDVRMEDVNLDFEQNREEGRLQRTHYYPTRYLAGQDHGGAHYEDIGHSRTREERHHRSRSEEKRKPSYAQSTTSTRVPGKAPNVLSPKDKERTRDDEMKLYFHYIDRRDYSAARLALGNEAYMRCLRNEHKRNRYH